MKINIQKTFAILSLASAIVWFGCKKDEDKKDPVATACNRAILSGFTSVLTDTCGDGVQAARLDGTRLSYKYDAVTDSLWFLQSVNGITASQAIGINIMVNNGKAGETFNFWGEPSKFGVAGNKNAFHKLLTVWVTGTAPSSYSGVIGIGNAAGIEDADKNRNFDGYTNEFKNNISIKVNTSEKTILLGMKRKDLVPDADFGTASSLSLKVASAVGANDGWNDDLFSASASFTLTKVSTGTKPVLSTSPIGTITSKTAVSGGSISSDGGNAVTERGLCWSKTNVNPTKSDNFKKASAAGEGDFSFTVSGLEASTTYYLRAYATNGNGTAYGNGLSFETKAPLTVLSNATSNITNNSCQVSGDVTMDGGAIVIGRGFVWSKKNNNPSLADSSIDASSAGLGSFNLSISGLVPSTLYNLRAFARTSIDTSYGTTLTITTFGPPTVSTGTISEVIDKSCKAIGNVSFGGGALVTVRGFVINTSSNPTLGSGIDASSGNGLGSFERTISSLSPNTTYYVRAYATNIYGTGYGEEKSFRTLDVCDPVTDIDGNTYQVVRIGNQCWMKENLRAIHFKNGANIPFVPDNIPWSNLTTGAYCNVNSDPTTLANFGLMYNWFIASEDNVCPTGWHVPTDNDWNKLVTTLGGSTVAGGKMKAINSLWSNPNVGANNSSNFSALPSGHRNSSGGFVYYGGIANFWSKEASGDPGRGSRMYLANYDEVAQFHNEPKNMGMSIRCIKD